MSYGINSDIANIDKSVTDIEQKLYEICGGDIIRWAITDVTDKELRISYSYKVHN